MDPETAMDFTNYRIQHLILETDEVYISQLPAGNVKSKDIIDSFIAGNRARFKAQQEMAQDIESAKNLGIGEL